MKQPFFKRINLFKSKEDQPEDPGEELTFARLGQATRVAITTNLNQPLKTIEDPAEIKELVNFIQTQQSGWKVPLEGVPVLPVRLNFYNGEKGLGNFGVGKQTFTAHQLGSFYARYPSPAERDRLVELIGLTDNFPD